MIYKIISLFIDTDFNKLIKLQLFLTLFYLPILLWWNLPISVMSILGNIIFTPFLIIFLALSVAVFFTELLHIPNSLIIYLLEKETYLWVKIINLGSPNWLIHFPHLSQNLLILISLMPIFLGIYLYINPKHLTFRYITIPIILLILIKGLTCFFYKNPTDSITINKHTDFNRPINPKQYDVIFCEDLEISTVKKLILLISRNNIKEIIIQNWNPSKIKHHTWKTWNSLLYMVKLNNIKLTVKD